jgi:3-oxoacyl-[acyl-carrier-protein] synthase II
LNPSVVITGLGAIAASGAGRESLGRALAVGVPLAHPVDRSAGYHRPGGARLAALAGGVELASLLPAAAARRMSPPSRLAVAAARLAVRDAGLAEEDPGFADTAVVVATAFGPALYTEKLLESIFGSGPESASPAIFTESVASAAASQVAIALRARGPSLTVTQREAGPLVAVGEGLRLLRAGRARRVLVGAVEEMTPLLHAILDRFHALARPDASGAEAARPFDRDRNGFLAGEGATFVVLEPASEASARAARPLCRVVAAFSAFDPSAPAFDWGRGEDSLAAALRQGLERSGVATRSIDRIVSGASGAVRGDRLEGLVLRRLWPTATLPPVAAPKAVVGEYGGTTLGAAVLAACGLAGGPTPGFRAPDPELGIVPHDGSPLPAARRVLTSALASGGAAAWAVLDAAG